MVQNDLKEIIASCGHPFKIGIWLPSFKINLRNLMPGINPNPYIQYIIHAYIRGYMITWGCSPGIINEKNIQITAPVRASKANIFVGRHS